MSDEAFHWVAHFAPLFFAAGFVAGLLFCVGLSMWASRK